MAELAGVLQVQERRVQSRQLLHLTILPPRRRCSGASFDHARSTTHPAVVAAPAVRAATAEARHRCSAARNGEGPRAQSVFMDMTTSSRTATPPPVRRLADALCTGAAERSQSSAGTRE